MQVLTIEQIRAMKGNGASMRMVLEYFIGQGAAIYLLGEHTDNITERFFLVQYEELRIPLRAYNLSFYSVYNSALAQAITSDKLKSYSMLTAWSISTPETLLFSDNSSAGVFIDQYGPCVVKPAEGAHGDGITLGVSEAAMLQPALARAQIVYPQVLIQRQIVGNDHRLLFVDYEFVAAVKRLPASIVGDGRRSIRQIVEANNTQKSALWADIRSGVASADQTSGSTSKTPIDEIFTVHGAEFLERVPLAEEVVQLLNKANVSLGGQTEDVTDQVNGELAAQLSELLKHLGLPLCGIDVISTDITSPPAGHQSYVIELNSAPGLRLHELPAVGQPHHVCAMVAESLINYYRNLSVH